MRNIIDIYNEYKIPLNLQLHQLKVAAVASQIAAHIDVVDRDSLIIAALLHDMGNVVKFDFTHSKELFGYSDEEVEKEKALQAEFMRRYGQNEHIANVEIARELGASPRVIELVDQNEFKALCSHRDSDDLEKKILHYADGRVSPLRICSYDERMAEAGKRYSNHALKPSLPKSDWLKLVDCGRDMEKQIFALTHDLKPEDITDDSVKPIIESLKESVL